MSTQKRYVLTGGPSVGKTTVSQILSSHGKIVIPEAARLIIEEQSAVGGDMYPWNKPAEFQNALALKQLELERQFNGHSEIFLDRSMLDGLAFCRFYGVQVPPEVTEGSIGNFDIVFLLEKLPKYSTDPGRMLTEDDSSAIHDLIEEEYSKRGYRVVKVPALPPEERADFILKAAQMG